MFCLRIVSLCLLLAVTINVSNGVQLNADNFGAIAMLGNVSVNEYKYLLFNSDLIETIAEDTFKECPNIRLLFLIENPVSVIPQNLFKYNTNLRVIHFRDNQIATLHPDTFAAQTSLVVLFLDQNCLTEIDEGLFRHNTNLTSLHLAQNRLTAIPPNTFTTLVHLKLIWLSENRLTSLPENLFAHNPKLEQIDFSENHIKTLPATLFKSNVNLEIVYLDRNRLSSFDLSWLLESPRMNTLSLYDNDLTEIASFDKLHQYWPQFKSISFTGNNFNCSYLRSIYDYCIEKGISVYRRDVKHPNDEFYHMNSCIEDKDFETVSAARINAPDAPYEDVQRTYSASEIDSDDRDYAFVFYENLYFGLYLNTIYEVQKDCEENRNSTFILKHPAICPVLAAY